MWLMQWVGPKFVVYLKSLKFMEQIVYFEFFLYRYKKISLFPRACSYDRFNTYVKGNVFVHTMFW